MMQWETKKLEDLADFYLGKMLDKKKNKGDYRPYLANVNVRWGGFELDDLREMRFEDREKERYGLECGDIVMCEGGEPGRCAIWKNQIPGMMFQKALHRIRPNATLDYRFLYYSFLNRGQEGGFDQYCTGATIKHLPRQNLAKIEVAVPPLETQQAIAAILSAYDDLIENNTRRIEILEEMARRLYEEWFVNFRFPGHEEVSFKDSELGEIPEGWNITPIKEAYEGLFDGPHATPKKSDAGPVFLGIKNLREEGGLDLSTIRHISEEEYPKWTKRVTPREGDIVFTYEATLNRYALIPKGFVGCLGRRLALIRPAEVYRHFLYLHFFSESWRNVIAKNTLSGATVDRIPLTTLPDFPVLLPPMQVASDFGQLVGPLFQLTETLAKKNANLRAQRDLLLPKLVSGEIDVSDITMPEDKEVEAA